MHIPAITEAMHIQERQYNRKAFTGILLTENLAVCIYREKLRLIGGDEDSFEDSRLRIKGKSKQVALKYAVSPKTIRDIWARRTWGVATMPLWKDCAGAQITQTEPGVVQVRIIYFSLMYPGHHQAHVDFTGPSCRSTV